MEEKYILETPKGLLETVLKGGELVARFGTGKKGILCSCTGNTEKTATRFVTKIAERKLECPNCGKVLRIVKTPEDFAAEEVERERIARENLHIVEVNYSWESGIRLYALSARIDYEDWQKVKHLFEFWRATEDAEDDEEWCDNYVGWATRDPEEVERILSIPQGQTLAYRRAQAEKQRKIEQEKRKQEEAKLAAVEKAFENAEYVNPCQESPADAKKYQKGYEKMRVDGEVIPYHGHERNIYGGGAWFVIQDKWIWKVQNNGADGDAWDRNNVETGGAGAIGVRVPFTAELANKIKALGGEKEK